MGEKMRINRYLASAGIDSRRKCERLIQQGKVRVNGKQVEELSLMLDPDEDLVTVSGREIRPYSEKIILALNKPADVISSVKDGRSRKTVIDIARSYGYKKRLFPVGRLDADTTGIILLTNDGELTYRLTHPRYKVNKSYVAVLEGKVEDETIGTITAGVKKGNFETQRCNIELIYRGESETKLRIDLREGKKRQIKRMFKIFGHRVISLHRYEFGGLSFEDLKIGELRPLTDNEEKHLREVSGLA
jgi:23S rRNA pseudouridine2605 synthase